MIDTLSLAEVCEALGCKKTKVFELLGQGLLQRAPKYGRALRVLADSVRRAQCPAPIEPRGRRPRVPHGAISRLSDFAAHIR